MTFRHLVRAVGLAVIGLALVACSSSDSEDESAGSTSTGEAAAMTETAAAMTETAASGGGDSGDAGHATVTIGDSTWEFEGFRCAFGHEATQSDVYAFSSDARGQDEASGANLQFQVDIRDSLGEGRFEGDGVTYEVHVSDISNFSDPAVQWESTNGTTGAVDGDHVTVQGVFDDGRTPDLEAVEGTVDATCGAGSMR